MNRAFTDDNEKIVTMLIYSEERTTYVPEDRTVAETRQDCAECSFLET